MSPVLTIIFGTIGVMVMGCALFGWGRVVRRVAGCPMGDWPVTLALGLGSLIFFGGILNLCHLAFPRALDLLLLTGLALAAKAWRDLGGRQIMIDSWPEERAARRYRLVFYILMLGLMGFTATALLFSKNFNNGDDFGKYLAHAVRMVQTGTLRGSPLNALGSETLGGQAVLHGFFVGHLPIDSINGADAVLCFGLCLAMAGGLAWRRPATGMAALAGLLVVVLIHPEAINISSLYSTAALFMGLVLLECDPQERPVSTGSRSAIPAALLMAGVVALKPTGILFLGGQIFFGSLAALWLARAWRPVLQKILWLALWSFIFLLPWLLLFAPEHIAGWQHPMPPPSRSIPPVSESINLFSPASRIYGGSYLGYTTIAIGLLFYTLAGLRRKEPAQRELALKLAVPCAAAAVAYFVVNVAGLYLVEADGALSYSIPTLIGVTPVVLGLGALCWDDRTWFGRMGRGTCCAVLFMAVLLALFFQTTIRRFEIQARHHSHLSYLKNYNEPSLRAYEASQNAILHEPMVGEIRRLQEKIPVGSSILVWIEAPFLLDYTRNDIVDVNESGLGTTWSVMPDTDYLLWQYQGGDVKTGQDYLDQMYLNGRRMGFVLARALDFQETCDELAKHSELVAHEQGFVVVRLKSGRATGKVSPK